MLAAVDLSGGWDLTCRETMKKLLEIVDNEKPDLVTMVPPCGPWCQAVPLDENKDAKWEWRCQRLPLWIAVVEVWKRQHAGRRLVMLEQPTQSAALKLSMLTGRPEAIRVVLDHCAFGLCDPQSGKPFQRQVIFGVNDAVFAKGLAKHAWCQHPPQTNAHQAVEGSCLVAGEWLRRSAVACRWTEAFCQHVLQAAENALKGVNHSTLTCWSMCEATEDNTLWETLAVTNASLPEEHLRKHLAENASNGERFDYVTFEGAANQQPRQLRSMVAHLHVTLGHLSNDRLARMLATSGAREEIVMLGRNLRCQICAMVRPPQATPQVAYGKPKQLNERIMGDSFYIWDGAGKRYAVTHFIDGLTDYHVGDLTVNPDSGFSRECSGPRTS